MPKISVTVKVSPPDDTWQSANELIKKIAETNVVGEELNIVVDGIFSAVKNQKSIINKNMNHAGNNSVIQIY